MIFIFGVIAGVALNQSYTRGWLKLGYEWIVSKAKS